MGLYVIGTSIMKELIRLSALTPFFQQQQKKKKSKSWFINQRFFKKLSMIHDR